MWLFAEQADCPAFCFVFELRKDDLVGQPRTDWAGGAGYGEQTVRNCHYGEDTDNEVQGRATQLRQEPQVRIVAQRSQRGRWVTPVTYAGLGIGTR